MKVPRLKMGALLFEVLAAFDQCVDIEVVVGVSVGDLVDDRVDLEIQIGDFALDILKRTMSMLAPPPSAPIMALQFVMQAMKPVGLTVRELANPVSRLSRNALLDRIRRRQAHRGIVRWRPSVVRWRAHRAVSRQRAAGSGGE